LNSRSRNQAAQSKDDSETMQELMDRAKTLPARLSSLTKYANRKGSQLAATSR